MDEVVFDQETRRQLAGSESHPFALTLEQGQYLEVVAEQQGVDVALELENPGGTALLSVDSPIGRDGPEVLIAVAETSGRYRLVVRGAEEGSPPGYYGLMVRRPRPATAEDRTKAEAERLFSRAEELRRQGEKVALQEALALYTQARESWRDLGVESRQADAIWRLGWVHRDLGESHAARESFTSALDLYRQIGDQVGEAVILNYRSGILWRLGETDQALAEVEASLSLSRDLGVPSVTMQALINLGLIHKRRNETERALEVYQEARTLASALRDEPKEAMALGNLGALLLSQGRLEEAADRLLSAQTVVEERGNLKGQAFVWNRLGDVRRRQGRLAEALQCSEHALSLRRQIGDRRGEATTLNSLGILRMELDQLEAGREAFQDALRLYRELSDPRGEAYTLFNLGRLHAALTEPQRSLDFHRQVTPFLERLGDRQLEASNQFGIARALRELGSLEAAGEELEEVLGNVEALRETTDREAVRMSFFATKQQYYDLAIDVRLSLHATDTSSGHFDKAFALSERRRARALLDVLGEDAALIRQDAPPELLTEEEATQRTLNELEDRRRALVRREGAEAAGLAELDGAVRRSREDLDEVRGKIRASSPRAELTRPEPVTLDDVRERLVNAETQILIYVLGEDGSHLWRIGHDQPSEFHSLPPRAEIEKQAVRAHRLLTSRNSRANAERRRHLERVSRMLLGPVAGNLTARRLVIVAEDALLYLPFAALPKPAPPPGAAAEPDPPPEDAEPEEMIRHHEIVHLPSTSVLLTLRAQTAGRPPAEELMAIFADPVFNSETATASEAETVTVAPPMNERLRRSIAEFDWTAPPPLPGTRAEAEAIEAISPDEIQAFVGHAASKKNVLEGLDKYQILHFATHGLFHRDHPELSGLVLSLVDEEGRSQDGFLRLHEIYNLPLSAELVVLSACRTGLGQQVRGEGLVGLTRGFMYAGAPRIIASLWDVSDTGTAELMKRFYWALLDAGAPPAVALRAAQIAMLDDEDAGLDHPFFWAGFIYQGDWRLAGDDDKPIEGYAAGAEWDDEEDPDYPGPDDPWCDGLTEPWQKRLCKILQGLRTTKSEARAEAVTP